DNVRHGPEVSGRETVGPIGAPVFRIEFQFHTTNARHCTLLTTLWISALQPTYECVRNPVGVPVLKLVGPLRLLCLMPSQTLGDKRECSGLACRAWIGRCRPFCQGPLPECSVHEVGMVCRSLSDMGGVKHHSLGPIFLRVLSDQFSTVVFNTEG